MGQKIHPYGLRLGIITDWKSRWYSEKDYAMQVNEDHKIRKYLRDELTRGAVSRIDIERLGDKRVQVDIHTGRPGVVIGRGGSEADRLRSGLEDLSGRQVKFNVIEVANPELDATLLARSVADQLEGRVAFRRAMKRAVSTALKAGAEGVRVQASGRLGGADMGRREWYLEGRVPLHTLRADVDFGQAVARTSVGAVGIKCWVYKGDLIETDALRSDKIAAEARLAAGGPSQRRRSARSRAEAAAGEGGGKRLIEAGGGRRTVEAGGGKRLIEAGGGKRKATAAEAAAEFEEAREEAEEVVEEVVEEIVTPEALPGEKLVKPEKAVIEDRVEEAEAAEKAEAAAGQAVAQTESLPEEATKDAVVAAEASAEAAMDTAESLPEEATKDAVVAAEAPAEAAMDTADSLPEEATKDAVVAAEASAEAAMDTAESLAEESTEETEVAAAQTESQPEETTTEDVVTSSVEADEAEDTTPREAAYRGDSPPADFTIKGNEGSMLYHRPDSSMYERTNAEVWFKTEEDAVAAGFTMAGTHPKPKEDMSESSALKADDSNVTSEGGDA